MSVFKACDIRGVAGDELTPALYRRIGRGLALILGAGRSIGVGGDVRLTTPELKAALVGGLCDNGCRVTELGIVPTPVVYFAGHHLGLDACAIVTASHNPPEYNGLKFMLGALPPPPEDMQRLEALVAGRETAGPRARVRGEVISRDVLADYEAWLPAAVGRLAPAGAGRPRGLTVVVDAGNGACSRVAPEVLGRMAGVRIVKLFCTPDGRFPGRHPDSAAPGNLTALSKEVQGVGASLGLAFDGDGDRVTFVDEQGNALHPDEAMVLFQRAFGGRMKGAAFVYDLKCSQVVAQQAKELGAKPIMERAGHAFIKRRMITERALFGGEISGHYFYAALDGGDDGLFSAMLMIRLLQDRDESLHAWRDDVPPRHVTPDVRIAFSPEETPELLEGIRRSFPESARNELDGIRITFPNGWGLVRGSITEPKVTLRFEGDSAADLNDVIHAFLEAAPEIRDEVLEVLARMREGESG